MARPKASIMDRFTVTDIGCWNWSSTSTNGYGNYDGTAAHRVVFEALVGPIPDGLVLDHLCKNRRCVNPEHLEPVTQQENFLRSNPPKTHCLNGHEFTRANTYVPPKRPTSRYCRTCRDATSKRFKERVS